ncbi:MAG: DoxX family membrane protein [Candidatus Sumerlaeia bacterium]|nr:DoxX family membrane protein [Candidatus Sumerlaeia bacterium]
MSKSDVGISLGLLVLRLVGGGALLLAGWLKVTGNPLAFALSIESFKLVPSVFVPALTYYLPWFEVIVGLAIVFGIWARPGAILAGLLYIGFILGLGSVLVRGMEVDCGCFAGLFGTESVGWQTIGRNVVLLACCAGTVFFGEGRFALLRDGVEKKTIGEVDPAVERETSPVGET